MTSLLKSFPFFYSFVFIYVIYFYYTFTSMSHACLWNQNYVNETAKWKFLDFSIEFFYIFSHYLLFVIIKRDPSFFYFKNCIFSSTGAFKSILWQHSWLLYWRKRRIRERKGGKKGKKDTYTKKKKKEERSGRYSNLTVSHVCHKPWFFHRRTKYAHTFPWKSLENNKRARYQGHKYSFSRDRISPSYPLGDFYRDKLRRRTPIASCQLFLRDDVSATALRCR